MKTKQILKSIFFLLITFFIFSSTQVFSANSLRNKLDNLDGNNTHIQKIAGDGGISTSTNLPTLISSIIKLILGLFGVISLIFIIRAGAMWMGSQGNPEKIKEARKIITAGIIGLAIIAMSYSIADFILSQVIFTTTR